jgi:hypothetical protein
MNNSQQRVWAVAQSHCLTNVLEYYCDDFEAFCEGLNGADEGFIVNSIILLISGLYRYII